MSHKKLCCSLLLLALFWIGCGKKEAPKQEQTPVVNAKQVEADQVVGIASVEPLERMLPITSEVNGVVDRIYYNSGEEVKKNEVLFSLEKNVEEAQLAQVKSKLATQAAIIAAQKSNKASIKVRWANAKTKWERSQKMFAGQAVTQQELDNAQADYESLQNDIAAADDNIAQQESKLLELKSDIQYFQTLLSRKVIKAPLNGTILNLDLKLGSIVTPNASVGDFAPKGPYMALTEIDELFANQVKVGQSAFVRTQGAKDTLTVGKVIFASPYLKKKSLFSDRADNLEDRRVREVRVQLDEKDKVLIGSRVECVIRLK